MNGEGMRVLLTAGERPLIRRHVLELAAELVLRRVQVTLASCGSPWTLGQDTAERIPGLEVIHCPLTPHQGDARGEELSRWLAAVVRRVEPDVIHLNEPDLVPAGGGETSRIMVVHVCERSRWAALHPDLPEPEALRPAWDRTASALQAVDLVVAPTRAMLETLRRVHAPLPPGRVIFHSRDPGDFPHAGPRRPQVLTVGSAADPALHLEPLLRIAASLPWPVVVAIPAGEEPSVPRGAPASVVLPRSRRELAEQMGQAGIFVLPARHTPFGIHALEAALAGCPLVLGDTPALREVWGDAAWFVPPDDAGQLRHAIQTLIRDPDLRWELGRRGRRRALFYQPSRMAREYHRLYRELAEPGGAWTAGGGAVGRGAALRPAG
jgi:glycogen synthase